MTFNVAKKCFNFLFEGRQFLPRSAWKQERGVPGYGLVEI